MKRLPSIPSLVMFSFVWLVFGSGIRAAGPISESFDSGASPDMEVSWGNPANVVFSGGVVRFSGTSNGGRAYLGTVETDYAGVDFVATVDVTLSPSTADESMGFFGLGVGTADAANNYGEPADGPCAVLRVSTHTEPHHEEQRRDHTTTEHGLGQGDDATLGDVIGPGTHTLRMTYTLADGLAVFAWDDGADGSGFVDLLTMDAGNNGFDAGNARIFIGGGNGPVIFDNLVVVTDGDEPPPVTHTGPVISEFLASNSEGITDEDGARSDWLEIYNGTGGSIDLGGWHLTDDHLALTLWTIPTGTVLEQGDYLLVWASSKDRAITGAELHTNFKIGAAGEYLALVRPDGVTVEDEWFPAGTEVAQRTDVSYGDTAAWDASGFFITPTPGTANGTSVDGFVADTEFDINRGVFTTPQSVTITSATTDAQIRYTTDGSTPTARHGTTYTGAIPISGTTVLRAAAFKAGLQPTNVDTHTYLFLDDVVNQTHSDAVAMGWPSGSVNGQVMDYAMDPDIVSGREAEVMAALGAIPSFSVVTDIDHLASAATGIYVNASRDGREWERPASIEMIGADGVGAFQIDGGIRIRGGYSRVGSNPKHAFRLFFRSEYGDKDLDYPLFGDEGGESFRKLDLRCAQGFSWNLWGQDTQRGMQNTYLRDVVSRYVQGRAGQPYTRSGFCHLYLNGHYWGLFQTQERPQKDFGASYFGGDDDEFDTIKTDQQPGGKPYAFATDGNLDAFLDLWTAARRANLVPSNPDALANYFAMQGLMPDGVTPTGGPVLLDVDNLIDFMLTIFFVASYDSGITEYVAGNTGSHNWYALRNRVAGDRGWAFFVHDVESSLNVVDTGIPLERRLDRTGPFNHSDQNNPTYANPVWIHQELCHNPEYRMRFADRAHRQLRPGGVMTEAATGADFDAWAAEVEQVIIAESARWGDSRRSTPYTKADWETARDLARDFLTRRERVVLQQLSRYNDGGAIPLYPDTNAPVLVPGGGTVAAGSTVEVHADGDVYYTLDGSDPRLPGGAVNPAAGHFAAAGGGADITIDSAATVMARTLSGGEWSALTETSYLLHPAPVPGQLAVGELMYHPADASGHPEFLELLNVGAVTVDLAGASFTAGIEFTFPVGTELAPGERLLLVSDLSAFETTYGTGLPVHGIFANGTRLGNDGERLVLTAADGGTFLLDFTYNDVTPWPTEAAGGGYSLVMRDPTGDPADESNWRPSALPGGAPGLGDSVPFSGDPQGDDDHDGVRNLVQHAIGGKAVRKGPSLEMQADGSLLFLHTLRIAADDVEVTAESSTDLMQWSNAGATLRSNTPNGDGTATLVWSLPVSPAAYRFLRLRIDLVSGD